MLEIEKLNKSNKKHSTSSRQNPAEERISGIEDKIKEILHSDSSKGKK
jgi:hypothetical protein